MHRSANLAFSLLVLVGSYSAILIPAYFHLDQVGSQRDHLEPKDLVESLHLDCSCP